VNGTVAVWCRPSGHAAPGRDFGVWAPSARRRVLPGEWSSSHPAPAGPGRPRLACDGQDRPSRAAGDMTGHHTRDRERSPADPDTVLNTFNSLV